MELITAQASKSNDPESDAILQTATKELKTANAQLVNASTTLSENTNTSTGGGNSTGASSIY
jgi:hypothetical protein